MNLLSNQYLQALQGPVSNVPLSPENKDALLQEFANWNRNYQALATPNSGDLGGGSSRQNQQLQQLNASPQGQRAAQLYQYGIQQGWLTPKKHDWMDTVSDSVLPGLIQAGTVAGIGGGLAGIAGIGPAAGASSAPGYVMPGANAAASGATGGLLADGAASGFEGASLVAPTGTGAGIGSGVGGGAAAKGGLGTLGKVGLVAGGAALLKGWGSILGGGGSTSTNNIPPMTDEEKKLIALNGQLAQKQLDQINQLQPFQKQLLDAAQADMARTSRLNAAMDAAVTPEQQAQQYQAEFLRNQQLGPMQDELLKLQLDQLRQGGKATPEQLQSIKEATDASIAAGTNDINTQTSRGIGLISDELANSRGLRLSDSPLSSEAALLTRAGNDQIASLTTNLRANQANSVLNYPLAVQGLQAGINTNQQSLNQAATQFQNQLRQQAYQNRLSLTGQAQSGGIGLAGIGSGNAGLNALTTSRLASGTTNVSKQLGLGDFAQLAGGIGGAMAGYAAASDRRLKNDFGVVGKTRSGIDIHAYRYKHEKTTDPLRLGVMADEVKKVIPNAVERHPSGFDMVRYDMVT